MSDERQVRQATPATPWSVVLRAIDSGHPEARAALEQLLVTYLPPLQAHARHPRWGLSPEDAEELVQQFCADLLERPAALGGVDRARGRFRHYLRAALGNAVRDRIRQRGTQKRGGDDIRSLDRALDDGADPAHDGPAPEALFERAWAHGVLERAMERMRLELERSGRASMFAAFRLSFDREMSYRDIATATGIQETDVTNYLHRARQHFGRALRAVARPTVEHPGDVDDEVRDLMRALGVDAPPT